MAYRRLIARLDIKSQNVIKGIQMEGLRIVGDPKVIATKYYESGADELLYIDTVATLYGRDNLIDIVRNTAQNIFIPLTVGGGIRTFDDAKLLLRSGADKVAINSSAVGNPKLLKEIAETFGSQCVVLSVDCKKIGNDWSVYVNNGRDPTGLFVASWVEAAAQNGVGEVLVTSVDRDGTRRGLDLDLMVLARSSTDLPLIGSGGAGTIADIRKGFSEADLDGIAIGAAIHTESLKLELIRKDLIEAEIGLRQIS
jgi:cyclase